MSANTVLKICLPGTCFIACFTEPLQSHHFTHGGAETLRGCISPCDWWNWGFSPELSNLKAAALFHTKRESNDLSWGAWTKVCLHVKASLWLFTMEWPKLCSQWGRHHGTWLPVHPLLGHGWHGTFSGPFISGNPFLCWQVIDRHRPKGRHS